MLNVGQRWTSTAGKHSEEVQQPILVHDEFPITPWAEKALGNIKLPAYKKVFVFIFTTSINTHP